MTAVNISGKVKGQGVLLRPLLHRAYENHCAGTESYLYFCMALVSSMWMFARINISSQPNG